MEKYNAIKYDVVIGAGVAGLVAAHDLLKAGRNVIVLEKEKNIGGALSSFKINDYWIESFYHHVFSGDSALFDLLRELLLYDNLEWILAQSSFYHKDKFYKFSNQLDVLSYSPLSFIEKVRLGISVLKIQKVSSNKLDSLTAQEWLIKNSGKSVYEKFYKPMLVSKFGKFYDNASAAWLADRLKLRANRGVKGEQLGYMKTGFHLLIDALKESIVSKGGKIVTGVEIKKIVCDDRARQLYYDDESIEVNSIISTISMDMFGKYVSLDKKYDDFQYQGALTILVGLDRKLSNYYWSNFVDIDVPFGAMVEHTNFKTVEEYSGDHIVYLASYPDNESEIWKKKNDEVFDLYFSGLVKIFPDLKMDSVLWYKISRLPRAGLVYTPGVMSKLKEIGNETGIKNVFIGSMFNTWPERSINSSVVKGKECADLVLKRCLV
jgi:protoporphyrinogen oxidase